jgi:uncharacterized protein DUF6089
MCSSLYSQKQYDVGVYVGGAYYMGEINQSGQFYKPRQNLGILYRYILNKRYAFKASINRARLVADDASSDLNFNSTRDNSFKHNIWDFSIKTEFNFFPYNTTDMKNRYTPYVTAGLSGIIFPVHLNLPIAIPFGVGVKYNFTRRIGLGMEWTFSRTFDDDWDFNHNSTYSSHQTALKYNKDWYSFVGLFLTYKFDESFECPAYD